MDGATIASAAGDAILVLTMVVFTFQAREMAAQSKTNTSATRAAVYQRIAQQTLEIDRLFIEKPQLRPYFYDSAPIPADPLERSQVLAVAEMLTDFFDNVVAQTAHIPDHLYVALQRYMAWTVASSPAMGSYWRQNRDWYSNLLQETLDSEPSAAVRASVRAESAEDWDEAGG